MDDFRIGDLATRAGVSIDAVRYYERLKLLPRARRTSGAFVCLGPESVERVQFINHAEKLGVTLDEIKGLLATGGADECRRVRDLLSKKIEGDAADTSRPSISVSTSLFTLHILRRCL